MPESLPADSQVSLQTEPMVSPIGWSRGGETLWVSLDEALNHLCRVWLCCLAEVDSHRGEAPPLQPLIRHSKSQVCIDTSEGTA